MRAIFFCLGLVLFSQQPLGAMSEEARSKQEWIGMQVKCRLKNKNTVCY